MLTKYPKHILLLILRKGYIANMSAFSPLDGKTLFFQGNTTQEEIFGKFFGFCVNR